VWPKVKSVLREKKNRRRKKGAKTLRRQKLGNGEERREKLVNGEEWEGTRGESTCEVERRTMRDWVEYI